MGLATAGILPALLLAIVSVFVSGMFRLPQSATQHRSLAVTFAVDCLKTYLSDVWYNLPDVKIKLLLAAERGCWAHAPYDFDLPTPSRALAGPLPDRLT
jgi:hypothetical protein